MSGWTRPRRFRLPERLRPPLTGGRVAEVCARGAAREGPLDGPASAAPALRDGNREVTRVVLERRVATMSRSWSAAVAMKWANSSRRFASRPTCFRRRFRTSESMR